MAVEASQVVAQQAVGFLARLRSLRARYGWLGVARRVMARAGDALLAGWRRMFSNRNHIYVYEACGVVPALPAWLKVHRFERLADVPPSYMEALAAFRSPQYVRSAAEELSKNGVLWVAAVDDRAVASSVSRRGKYFRRWYLPLRDDDMVVFAGSTAPSARGRGVMAAMLVECFRRDCQGRCCALTDCKSWNRAAIRTIEKAGFRRIATMKPLRRKDALGE